MTRVVRFITLFFNRDFFISFFIIKKSKKHIFFRQWKRNIKRTVIFSYLIDLMLLFIVNIIYLSRFLLKIRNLLFSTPNSKNIFEKRFDKPSEMCSFFDEIKKANWSGSNCSTFTWSRRHFMKNYDVIKALLLAAVNEIPADPEKYAINPGRDFTRNRKMGFHDTLMLLTMEADCIKEEFYRYFGRTTDVPSKAAFYRQRCKLTGDALANLLYAFNSRLQKNLYNRKY